jgi:2-methylcitrate dehydratase PrpD
MEAWLRRRDAIAARVDGAAAAVASEPGLRERALLVVLDDLAAMVFASGHAEVSAMAGAAVSRAGEEATVVAGGRAARERAAAANAVAAAWDELDEGYRPATCHGGLYAVPAALAEVEAESGALDDLLTAVLVGYEVATAVARAFPAPKPPVLHPHATLSPVGAAAAITWLRTRSGAVVVEAADVAASMSMVGPFNHATGGAQDRNAWAAGGALLGFLAADSVALGLGGLPTTVADVFGSAFGQPADPAELAAPLERWAIHDGYHKPYAACQYTHAALECALDLAGRVDATQVEEVVVATHPLALALDDVAPTTALGGKFSVPHVVASVLVRGAADAAAFAAPGLSDPAVDALRRRVRLASYGDLPAAPHDRPARVTVTLRDGTVAEAECLSARGGPDRPLDVGDVLAKIGDLTASRPGFADQARALLDGRVPGAAPWRTVVADLLGGMS